ncbi:MAG: HK97 gp10 family phage protein [Dehalococcoidales bacterium]|nr:HK97 gp10 family phage protein [Dehalococcoidales bacterium]
MTEIIIEGMAELEGQLKKLSKQLGADKVEPVLYEAAKDLAQAIKSHTPKHTGQLRKSIRARKLKRYLDNAAAGAGVDQKKAPHAHLVEYGTAQRHHKSGKSVGSMPARPFVRPAWDANRERITRKVVDDLKGLIDQCL